MGAGCGSFCSGSAGLGGASCRNYYMKLSELKEILKGLDAVEFILPSGEFVPNHFHVTEVGQVNKKFIDCGGVVREEKVINFQLWTANDYDHRLSAEKLNSIIELSEKTIGLEDLEIEVEYQSSTVGKYSLSFDFGKFMLESTHTDCLAKDNCGIPQEQMPASSSCCTPGGGCC